MTDTQNTAHSEPFADNDNSKVDLVVDTAGGPAAMLLAFSARAAGILSTTKNLVRAFGAHLGDRDIAEQVVRRALKHGLVVRVDGQTFRGMN